MLIEDPLTCEASIPEILAQIFLCQSARHGSRIGLNEGMSGRCLAWLFSQDKRALLNQALAALQPCTLRNLNAMPI